MLFDADPLSRSLAYSNRLRGAVMLRDLPQSFDERVCRFARTEREGISLSYWLPTAAYVNLGARGDKRLGRLEIARFFETADALRSTRILVGTQTLESSCIHGSKFSIPRR